MRKEQRRKLKKRNQDSKTPQPGPIVQPLVPSTNQTRIELNTENQQLQHYHG